MIKLLRFLSFSQAKLYFLFLVAMVSLPLQAQTITFGIPAFAPWSMVVNGEVVGINVDQSKLVADHAGLDLVIAYSPYKRMRKQLLQGEIDCVISTKNPKLKDKTIAIQELYQLDVTVISRKNEGVNSYEELIAKNQGITIGFAHGTAHFHADLYNDSTVNKLIIQKQSQGPSMILRNRIDAFVGIEKTMLYELRKQGLLDKVSFPGYKVNTLPVLLYCSKQSDVANKYREALYDASTELLRKDEFKKIIDHWIAPLSSESGREN